MIKGGVNTESLRVHHNSATQYTDRNGYDVNRLVATKHVRNKDSMLESFMLYCSRIFKKNLQRRFDSF